MGRCRSKRCRQTFKYKMNKFGNLMHSMVTIVSNTILYIYTHTHIYIRVCVCNCIYCYTPKSC